MSDSPSTGGSGVRFSPYEREMYERGRACWATENPLERKRQYEHERPDGRTRAGQAWLAGYGDAAYEERTRHLRG